jgi:hypothetical protein
MSISSGKIENDGSLTSGSMSATIERALADLVPLVGNDDPMGRRKLALAIARGVIKHISDNEGAITVSDGVTTYSASIDVDLGGWS